MMEKLLFFLENLEEKKIHYKLSKIRESILVEIAVPGQRWEVEFFKDNHIEIEKFISNGIIYEKTELEILFQNFSD